MPSNAFILGKYDRKNYSAEDISESASTLEGDGKEILPKTHIYNNLHAFSNHTERDEEQVVGKLYKGYVDDEDEMVLDDDMKSELANEHVPRLRFGKGIF